jgi:hypothetical protein
MFLISKKICGFSYYYNFQNHTWYGIKENATAYNTREEAASDLNKCFFIKKGEIIFYK